MACALKAGTKQAADQRISALADESDAATASFLSHACARGAGGTGREGGEGERNVRADATVGPRTFNLKI